MISDVRSQFPALKQKVNGAPLVYLDSAATSLKPQVVVDTMTEFYARETANVHRGAHYLSDRATVKFEEARKTVAQFVGRILRKKLYLPRAPQIQSILWPAAGAVDF